MISLPSTGGIVLTTAASFLPPNRCTRARPKVRRLVGRNREPGQSAIELAILLPVFLTMAFGAIDLGRAFYSYVVVSSAAQSTAEFLARHPSATNTDLRAAVVQESGSLLAGAPSSGPGSFGVTESLSTVNGVRMATIRVSYSYAPVTPLPFDAELAISSRSSSPIVEQP